MKLCVVGNGPSAKGQGAEIDACDFVVRIKAWWAHGAEDAGEKIDAWAWYGDEPRLVEPAPVLNCEHWLTLCNQQMSAWADPDELIAGFKRQMARRPIENRMTRRLWDSVWVQACEHLDREPSTGFVAVAMAIQAFDPDSLLLIGFDSLTADQPNYDNARHKWGFVTQHHFDTEKRAMAEIRNGTWLGEPIETKLEWIGEPSHAA